MAEKLKDIYQKVIIAIEASAELSDLNTVAGETMAKFVSDMSKSKVSIWRLWCFIVAFFVWTLQKNDDIIKLEIEYWAKLKQGTTLKWYQEQTLQFLLGKPLIWNSNLGKFTQEILPSDDVDALRVIKYCAATKSPNEIRIKVATDNAGVPGTISTAEENAVINFLDQIKSAGDNIEVVNLPADSLKIVFAAYVDPLVININTGELHAEPGVKPVEDEMKAYLFNLDFNGRFTRNYFIDALQKAQGVKNIDLNILEHKYGLFSFQNIDVSVIPDAGYFKIDSFTINYLPEEV